MMMNGNKIKSCKLFSNFYANSVSILISFQGFVMGCSSLDIKFIMKGEISKLISYKKSLQRRLAFDAKQFFDIILKFSY